MTHIVISIIFGHTINISGIKIGSGEQRSRVSFNLSKELLAASLLQDRHNRVVYTATLRTFRLGVEILFLGTTVSITSLSLRWRRAAF